MQELRDTPVTSRGNLAIDYYDDKIFDGATYADLEQASGPLIQIGRRLLRESPEFKSLVSRLQP